MITHDAWKTRETKMNMERKQKEAFDWNKEKKELFKKRINQLAEYDKIISSKTVDVIGEVTKNIEMAEDNVPSSDEFDEDLEDEYRHLNDILNLPNDTYSLTEIRPELPPGVKYGVRSGLVHLSIPQFSPLSRGHQVILIIHEPTIKILFNEHVS